LITLLHQNYNIIDHSNTASYAEKAENVAITSMTFLPDGVLSDNDIYIPRMTGNSTIYDC